jgi:hypothetical protein
MQFELEYSAEANSTLDKLEAQNAPKFAKVTRALGLMEMNLQHPSLCVHRYHALTGPKGEDVWEAYAENNTPTAWRIFFCYSKDKRGVLSIIAITPHP